MAEDAIFEKLVANIYVPDLDYFGHCFPFQTVFCISGYSYQCCSCAYEHEFVDYISDNGQIDDEMFCKITKCIADGKCPHVDEAPKDHLTETKIYGIHLATAVGIKRGFNRQEGTAKRRPVQDK